MGRYKVVLSVLMIFICANLVVMSAQEIPISGIRVHDPVMIKEGSIYHLFCTGLGISHFTSSDMKNWEKQDPVFLEKPEWFDEVVPGFRNHIWAPDIVYQEGTFYLYYSISSFGKNTSAIGVVTNKTLDVTSSDYDWIDHGVIIQSHPNRDLWNAIDPNIAYDENGTPWMSFGSFWNGLKLVQLSDDLLALEQPQDWYTIARREREFVLDDKNPGNAHLEAPFIFKKNGWYYLFISWDICCRGNDSTYKVVVGRSMSIKGPYFDKNQVALFNGGGSLVLEGNQDYYGAGHCSVYTLDNQDYILFHAYDAKDGGRPKLKIAEVEWDEDGWPRQFRKY